MGLSLVNSDIQVIANEFLPAYQDGLESMSLFSFEATADNLVLGDTVKVGVYAVTDDAGDFNAVTNNYEDEDDNSLTYENVVITSHKKKTIGLTDFDLKRSSPEEFLRENAKSLAKTVMQDIYTVITAANFPTVAFTGAATTYDSDDIADFWVDAETANWGDTRHNVMNVPYIGNLLKDPDLKNVEKSGTDATLRRGEVGIINGFDVHRTKVLPGNGENLVGYITDGTAIAIAMALPEPPSDQDVQDFAVASDPESGLSILVRRHYAPAPGKSFINVEAVYGFKKIRSEGLQRCISA